MIGLANHFNACLKKRLWLSLIDVEIRDKNRKYDTYIIYIDVFSRLCSKAVNNMLEEFKIKNLPLSKIEILTFNDDFMNILSFVKL